jgi:hypothetical protein
VAAPIWLPENHVDRGLYPGHGIVASHSVPGFEVARLADGLRDATRWKGSTANVQVTITWDCGVVRLASALFLDRGHNLGGKQWLLEGSGDNFATAAETVLSMAAHPTGVGGRLDEVLGAVALDGSFGISYAPHAFRWWRLRIPPVASYIPELTGLYSGRHFQLARGVPMPYSDYDSERFTVELQSSAGRIGRSRTYRRRQGAISIRAGSEAEYTDNLRVWLEDTYRDKSQPAWLVLDPEQAPETMLNVICPDVQWAFATDHGAWPFPAAAVPFIENTPETT